MEIEESLANKMRLLPKPTLMAISGFGGSGKSKIASKLGSLLNAPVVSVDSFQKDRTLKDYSLWNTMDFQRLEDEVLKPFHAREFPITYGHFDWGKNGIIEEREIQQTEVLIVEGVGLFRPDLNKYFTCKIWIDCPIDIATERGKKRDREVHKNPQDELWDGIWKENDLEYYSTFKPFEVADFTVINH